ncbi:MAG: YgdI/YgdR family lipoprotein [Gammaproteobacteria bacterium]|nr:YgdI/YgdR family lipoprotein [Gammaproteobacteria bacterium]
MSQRHLTAILLALLSCALTACATNSPIEQQDDGQARAIERWHRCVDNSMIRLSSNTAQLNGMVKETLVVCQGHKSDVLATFPTRMEKAVDNLMVEQVYESGLTQLAGGKIQGADFSQLGNSLLSLN